jgi:hypothetical protein
LIEFRTRKAHRWVVRDKDLLKYLLGMVLVVFGYMAAWTATNLNFIQENYDVLTVGTTYEGMQFLACKALWWDYVTETGMLLIMCHLYSILQVKNIMNTANMAAFCLSSRKPKGVRKTFI